MHQGSFEYYYKVLQTTAKVAVARWARRRVTGLHVGRQNRGLYRREDDEEFDPGADIVELRQKCTVNRHDWSTGMIHKPPEQVTALDLIQPSQGSQADCAGGLTQTVTMMEPTFPDAAEMPWEVLLTDVGNISAAAPSIFVH